MILAFSGVRRNGMLPVCSKAIISAPNRHAEPLIGANGMIGIGIAVDMECQHPALTIAMKAKEALVGIG